MALQWHGFDQFQCGQLLVAIWVFGVVCFFDRVGRWQIWWQLWALWVVLPSWVYGFWVTNQPPSTDFQVVAKNHHIGSGEGGSE